MNSELCKIDNWFKANKLSLNVKKSSYMMFIPRNLTHNNSLPTVHIDHNTLEKVAVTKFLGVLIDDNLTWKTHISFVSNKIGKNIGIIRRIIHLVSRKILLNLYYTMIYPYFPYCNVVWCMAYKTTLNSLVIIQKRTL